MKETSDQPHPLDVDDDAPHIAIRSSFSDKSFSEKVRFICVLFIIACGVVILVTGIWSVNARPMSPVQQVLTWLNRASMFALLAGFVLLLLSYRAGFDQEVWFKFKRKWASTNEASDNVASEQDYHWGTSVRTEDPLAGTRSPLSLALLFYLITIAAILFATFQLLRNETTPQITRLTNVSGGVATGFFVGAVAGALLARRATATIIGSLVGLPVGGLAGLLGMIAAEQFSNAVAITFIGCGLLITLTLIAARFQHPEPIP